MPLTTVNPALLDTQAQYTGFKNRIINGAMVIDQRNAGASVTSSGAFPVDRFLQFFTGGEVALSGQQNSSAPAGFTQSIKFTVTTAESSVGSDDRAGFQQRIEGTNIADLAWGTANAKTVTLSFWVRSSLTGTFGGVVRNSANDRSYPFTYSISVADTWEYKTVTIPGDTSGTWLTTTGIGLVVNFSLMAGTNYTGAAGAWASAGYQGASGQTQLCTTLNATFYITGVQLEKGSTATSFDYRPYGTELALCQRYFWRPAPFPGVGTGQSAAQVARMRAVTPATMRSTPTISLVGQPSLYNGGGVGTLTGITTNYSSPGSVEFDATASTSMVLYACVVVYNNYDGATVAASAEL